MQSVLKTRRFVLLFCVIILTPETIRGESPMPRGCYVNGLHYLVNEEVSREYDEESNYCSGKVCTYSGEIFTWHNYDCKKTTTTSDASSLPTEMTTPTTTELVECFSETTSTTIAPTTQVGCYDNGNFFPTGSEISKGYDENSNWCYGSYCDDYGQVQAWDNFNCKKTTVIPTTTPPTTPTTPTPTSTPQQYQHQQQRRIQSDAKIVEKIHDIKN